MDAVNFLKEWRRMCIAIGTAGCGNCPARCPDFMEGMTDDCIENAMEVVTKWAKEHPQKTRLADLKEHYPDFDTRLDGYPSIYPRVFGYCGKGVAPRDCLNCDNSHDIKKCWDVPMEE